MIFGLLAAAMFLTVVGCSTQEQKSDQAAFPLEQSALQYAPEAATSTLDTPQVFPKVERTEKNEELIADGTHAYDEILQSACALLLDSNIMTLLSGKWVYGRLPSACSLRRLLVAWDMRYKISAERAYRNC